MVQPQGFVSHEFLHHVCNLKKAFYSLKQASKAWFNKLSTYFMQRGFKCSQYGSSI